MLTKIKCEPHTSYNKGGSVCAGDQVSRPGV